MMFHIESIEIVEELGHPLIHDLMVRPPELKLVQKYRSTLGYLGADGGQNVLSQIMFNCLSVSLVKFTRMVVGGPLGTHVVTEPMDILLKNWAIINN